MFQAVASPTRRAILDALTRGEANVSELVARVSVTQSAVSQQLAVLKSAGLVGERSDGRFRYYSLRAEPLGEIDLWMARYRAVMEARLDTLGAVLDSLPDLPEEAADRRRARPARPVTPRASRRHPGGRR